MIEFNDTLDQIITEAATLPKLSQTSLFQRFDQVSKISQAVVSELGNGDRYRVKPSDIEEILSLMKLNGSVITKKAVAAYMNGQIIIINNKETSQIPMVLPFIIASSQGKTACYIFADKVVTNIKSNQEYKNLMAVMEAGYMALQLQIDQKRFTMNAQLMLSMCDCWWRMVISPLESKIYMKGDNLTKAIMYSIAFFYKNINGTIAPGTVPFARFIRDKVEPSVQKKIIEDVNALTSTSIMALLGLIKQINPVRYKDLDSKYINYFSQVCGMGVMFALENLQYLFLVITSAVDKTNITGYSLNKVIQQSAKRAEVTLINMNI